MWKDLGGGFGRPLALPLGLYAVQLAISWTFLTLFFAAYTPGLVRCTELSSGSNAGAGQSGAGRSGGQTVSSSGVHKAPGTWLRGSRVLQEGRGPRSQASLPDHPAPCPGPAAPAAALRAGGDHGADLAPHQQAGRPAPAALPGLAHCLRFHHLPPVEGQSLSRAPASARGGEE